MAEGHWTAAQQIPELTEGLRLKELDPLLRSQNCVSDVFDDVVPSRYEQSILVGEQIPVTFSKATYFRLVYPTTFRNGVSAVEFTTGTQEAAGMLREKSRAKLGELASLPLVSGLYDLIGEQVTERVVAQGSDRVIAGIAAGFTEVGNDSGQGQPAVIMVYRKMLDITYDALKRKMQQMDEPIPDWLEHAVGDEPLLMTQRTRSDVLSEAMAKSYLLHTLPVTA